MIQAAQRRLVGILILALSLSALEESGAVRGRVVDIAGGALPSAVVRLYRPDLGKQYEDHTDSAGHFHIKGLPAGTYKMTISLRGFLDKTIPEVQVIPGQLADVGVLRLDLAPCNSPGGPICDEVKPIKTPVLTVCEALRDLDFYNGKEVVIVGRYAWTLEGQF